MQMWTLQNHEQALHNLVWTDKRLEILERCSKLHTSATTSSKRIGNKFVHVLVSNAVILSC